MKALLCTLTLAGTISAVAMSSVSAQTGGEHANDPIASPEKETAVSKTLARAKDALRRAFLEASDAPDTDTQAAQQFARAQDQALRDQQRSLRDGERAHEAHERAIQAEERAIQQMEEHEQRNLERIHRDNLRADEQAERELLSEQRAQLQWAKAMLRDAKTQERAHDQLAEAMVIEADAQERRARSRERIHEQHEHEGRPESRELVERLRELEEELARLSTELQGEESGSKDSQRRRSFTRSPRALREFFEVREPRAPRAPRQARQPRQPREPRPPREVREPREPREPRAPRVLWFDKDSDDDCQDQCDEDDECDAPRSDGPNIFRFKAGGNKFLFEKHDDDDSDHQGSGGAIVNGQRIIWADSEGGGSCNYSVDVDSNGVTVFQVNGDSEPQVIYRHHSSGGDSPAVWAVPDGVPMPHVFHVEMPDMPDMADIEFPDFEMMEFDVPEFELREFEFPEIEMLELEDYEFPELEEFEYEFPGVKVIVPSIAPTRLETTVEIRTGVPVAPSESVAEFLSAPLAFVRAAHSEPAPEPRTAVVTSARTEAELLDELIGLMHGLKDDMGSLKADIQALHAEIESTDPH